jgi:hypothetical protein
MTSPENQSEMTMADHLDLSRRDFGKLTLAALAGMAAGAATVAGADDKTAALKNPLFSDPHVCRGLNTCKGKGAGKKNACAGMGQCATAAKHGCGSQNECKGQGGCGEHPGENTCKGQGECSVPMHSSAWKKARARYEVLMKQADKKFGKAPDAKKA